MLLSFPNFPTWGAGPRATVTVPVDHHSAFFHLPRKTCASAAMFGGGGDKDDEGIRSRWSKCGFLSKLPLSQCVLRP